MSAAASASCITSSRNKCCSVHTCKKKNTPSSLNTVFSSCGVNNCREKEEKEKKKPLYVIAATTPKFGIGKDNKMPWGRLPADMHFFTQKTTETKRKDLLNAVIMGRKTWTSIKDNMKPLKGRINFVISNTLKKDDLPEGVVLAKSFEEAYNIAQNDFSSQIENIYAIGGSRVYEDALLSGLAGEIYITRLGKDFECDAFFPNISSEDYKIIHISNTHVYKDVPFDFVTYKRLAKHACTCSSNASQAVCTNGECMPNNKEKETAKGEQENNKNKCNCSINYNEKNNNLSLNNKEKKVDVCTTASASGGQENEKEKQEEKEEKEEEKEEEGRIIACPYVLDRTHEEFQYLDLISELIFKGAKQEDRTGVGILSCFGRQMRFNLRESFPLLTTKRIFWRGVVEELLWFIRGDTNANNLTNKGIKIWEKNGTREFLDSRGLNHREVGDLGPVYGFQWRHFGAEYVDMHADYTNKGVDQLRDCIEKIKTNPFDRRIIMSAWNPSDLPKMALPICHMFCQFYVCNGELSCLMYQRSCDVGLGVPFNIASYALLTRIIAHICGLKAGEFVHTLGNAHVYLNHVEPLKTQLQRTPLPFPILKINPDVTDIDNLKFEDFELIGYNPHKKIDMDMAV